VLSTELIGRAPNALTGEQRRLLEEIGSDAYADQAYFVGGGETPADAMHESALFARGRQVFLPEDFRVLRRWLHAAARRPAE